MRSPVCLTVSIVPTTLYAIKSEEWVKHVPASDADRSINRSMAFCAGIAGRYCASFRDSGEAYQTYARHLHTTAWCWHQYYTLKCEWFYSFVNYLGHVIQPGKLAKINHTIHPNQDTLLDIKDLQSLPGLCNVFQRVVSNFARIAAGQCK